MISRVNLVSRSLDVAISDAGVSLSITEKRKLERFMQKLKRERYVVFRKVKKTPIGYWCRCSFFKGKKMCWPISLILTETAQR